MHTFIIKAFPFMVVNRTAGCLSLGCDCVCVSNTHAAMGNACKITIANSYCDIYKIIVYCILVDFIVFFKFLIVQTCIFMPSHKIRPSYQ